MQLNLFGSSAIGVRRWMGTDGLEAAMMIKAMRAFMIMTMFDK